MRPYDSLLFQELISKSSFLAQLNAKYSGANCRTPSQLFESASSVRALRLLPVSQRKSASSDMIEQRNDNGKTTRTSAQFSRREMASKKLLSSKLHYLVPKDDVPLTPGICSSLTCFRPFRMRYSMVLKSLRFTSAHCRRNSFLACDVVVLAVPLALLVLLVLPPPLPVRRVVSGICWPGEPDDDDNDDDVLARSF